MPSLLSKTPRLTVSNDAAFQVSKTPPLYRKVVSTLNSKSPSKTPRLLPSLTGLQDCSPVFQDSSNCFPAVDPFHRIPHFSNQKSPESILRFLQNLSTGSPEPFHRFSTSLTRSARLNGITSTTVLYLPLALFHSIH